MHIRKNTHIDVTIFDVSSMDTMEKKGIFDQVMQMHTDSITSLSEKDKVTRLIVPTVFSKEHTKGEGGCGTTVRSMLFNDILGYDKTTCRNVFGDTRIISSVNIVSNKKGKIKSKQSKILSIDDDKVYSNDVKTNELIERHHKKLLKSSNKVLEHSEESYDNVIKRGICLNPFTTYLYSNGTSETFNPRTSILRKVDKILFIDSTYSLSEMKIALEQTEDLFRVAYNYVGSQDGWNIIRNYNDFYPKLKLLYNKLGVKDKKVWDRDFNRRENIHGSGNFMYHACDSLFNDDDELLDNDNVLVPVTFVVFLEEASHLFLSSESIIREEHTIKNPQFFISKISASHLVGVPEFINTFPVNNNGRIKQQSREFTNLTMDLYSLKTTLINIPMGFSSRLIKSKLKSVNKFEVNKDCFHFFNDNQESRIGEKGKNGADILFCIAFDGLLDLSYYTCAINMLLVNNFASEFYTSSITSNNLIFCSQLFTTSKESLDSIYNYLVKRQENLSLKFNDSEITLLSKEMFDYERANLLSIYILKEAKLKLYDYSRPHWNSPFTDELLSTITKNNGFFSRDIWNKHNYSGVTRQLNIGSIRKTLLIETMFRLVRTLSQEQLLLEVDSLIKESVQKMQKELDVFIKRQSISKDITTALMPAQVGIRYLGNSRDIIESIVSKTRKKLVIPNYKMYNLLYNSKSLQLIPIILADTLLLDYIERLQSLLRMYGTIIRIYGEITPDPLIDSNGLSSTFLTNKDTLLRIERQFGSWYASNRNEFNFIKHLLERNLVLSVKIEVLEKFTDLIISEFTKDYFSSEKK